MRKYWKGVKCIILRDNEGNVDADEANTLPELLENEYK